MGDQIQGLGSEGFIIRIAIGLHHLRLIALTLVTTVPGIGIGRILQRIGGNFLGRFHFHCRRLIVLLFGYATLILQNTKEGVVTVKRSNLLILPETPNQSKKIPGDHLQGLSRLRRLHQRETAHGLLGPVTIYKFFLNGFKDLRMATLQVDEERVDTL